MPALTNLTDEQRRQVESWLAELRQAWDEKRLSSVVRRLPAAGDPVRPPALAELVRADLEQQWRNGRRVRLEAYLRAWPELGTSETVPVDLIQTEVNARHRAGEAVSLPKFAERFPRQAGDLVIPPAEGRPDAPPASDTRRSSQSVKASTKSGAGSSATADVPEQIGRYRIVKQLGQGGMGAVYLANDTQLDRQVALKVPRFAADDGPEILARFHREARSAATLQHPNICPVYEIGEADGHHYVTMAYIEGRPLSDLIKEGKALPQKPAAAVVRKLARAMEEAHSKNIVHRDLKPANVMINHRNEPIIMDFGLARRVNETIELTRRGAMVGTPAYMAPEQIRGNREEIGPACDVYSLGVILYELLTGQLPFQGPLPTIIGQVLAREPDPPSQLRPDLDPQLEVICLKAMAKNPELRYASMTELAAALGDYLKTDGARPEGEESVHLEEGEPAALPVPARLETARPPTPRRPGLATQLLAELNQGEEAKAATGLESVEPAERRPPLWPWIVTVVVLLVVGAVVGAVVFANLLP